MMLPLHPNNVESIIKELEDKLLRTDVEINKWAKNYASGHIEHYKSIIENVLHICDSGKISNILDMGSVPGHIPAIFKYAGFSVDAVDIDPMRARGGVRIYGNPLSQGRR